jgi:predicted short-subunit dehydrogenase-like oxidoreductase (DUF2520 family)
LGQVPASTPAPAPAPYGFVGDGRLSRHWRHFFSYLGLPWKLWSRRLARAGGAGADPVQALAGCPVLLLAVSDDAIEATMRRLAAAGLGDRSFVHFSGGRSIEGAFGAHPLMSFAQELYEPDFYGSIPVFVEPAPGWPDPVARFRELFPALPNPCFRLRREDKPHYHALCSLAGGMTAVLWREFFDAMAERYGVPREALAAYPRRIVANVIRAPESALTGPVVRGDAGTIRAHLSALEGAPLAAVYRAFVAAAGRPT